MEQETHKIMHNLIVNVKLESTETLETRFFLLISSYLHKNICHKISLLESLDIPESVGIVPFCDVTWKIRIAFFEWPQYMSKSRWSKRQNTAAMQDVNVNMATELAYYLEGKYMWQLI